ncbi:MAG TPA: tetratricopeptide repeat protein [Polyangiaceae bacterium]|nr:tetratricopeptide repeat protein [Polyangiaceae bacterium]
MRVVRFARTQRTLAILGGALVMAASITSGAQESELDALRASVRASPADPAAALALGRALRRAGHLGDAQREIRRGIAVGVASPDIARGLRWEAARVEFDRRDFFQSVAACKPLETLSSAEAHACLADADLVRQRATEALDETATALAKDPRCYEAKVAEGRAYDLELDVVHAESSLRAAIAMLPDGVDGHLALGRVLVKEGQGPAAITELRKAVSLDPHGPDAAFALATALQQYGGPGAAREVEALLQQATNQRPSFADAWLALGGLELERGLVAQAGIAGEAVLRSVPTDVGARVLLGKVALSQGRADDAIKQGEAALKVVSNSAAAKLLVADANAKKGEIDAAIEAYQAAWGLDHRDPTPLVHASVASHGAGRDTTARAFAVRATQEFPKWGPGWAALGDALAGQGERGLARDAYRSALVAPDGAVDKAAVAKRLATLQ